MKHEHEPVLDLGAVLVGEPQPDDGSAKKPIAKAKKQMALKRVAQNVKI
jgi:hypothetical protein